MHILFEECDKHKYGLTCNQTCGSCYGGKQCDHVNGNCTDGCEAGFFGEKCDEGWKKLYLKQDLHNTHNKSIKIEISLSAQLFYTNKSFIIDKCTSEVTIVIKINALIYIFYLFYYF